MPAPQKTMPVDALRRKNPTKGSNRQMTKLAPVAAKSTAAPRYRCGTSPSTDEIRGCTLTGLRIKRSCKAPNGHTEEQKTRIEQKRLEALRRRREKLGVRAPISASTGFHPQAYDGQKEEKNFPNPDFHPRQKPLVIITGNGAGRWYTYNEDICPYKPGPEYRHVHILNSNGPLHFYHCNVEHMLHGEAHLEITDSANVYLYGIKTEGRETVVLCKNSRNICIFGCGGIANAHEGKALYIFENCRDFLIALPVDILMWMNNSDSHWSKKGDDLVYFIDPKKWHMVADCQQGLLTLTKPLHRPVVYQRGKPCF